MARLAWNSRLYCSSSSTTTTTTVSPDQVKKAELSQHPVLDLPSEDDGFRERFIPVSRRSLVAQLMQKENFLTSAECKRFEEFALALDNAIDNQFHGVLAELKVGMFEIYLYWRIGFRLDPCNVKIMVRKWRVFFPGNVGIWREIWKCGKTLCLCMQKHIYKLGKLTFSYEFLFLFRIVKMYLPPVMVVSY